MEENFKIEIISPEEIIFSDNTKMAKIPSYEGDMSILKNHISIISFLRPGIVSVEKTNGEPEVFFVKDGTVEFFENTLVLLSESVKNIKNLTKEFIENLSKETENKLGKDNINDEERYILNHQLDALKEIRV